MLLERLLKSNSASRHIMYACKKYRSREALSIDETK